MQFFTGMGSVLIIYYLFVLVRYYPDKLKNFFAPKSKKPEIQSSFFRDEQSKSSISVQGPEEEYDEFEEIENLVSTLQDIIKECSEDNCDIGYCKNEINVALDKVKHLRDSPYRTSINQLITSECEKYGTFMLSEKEVNALWDEKV